MSPEWNRLTPAVRVQIEAFQDAPPVRLPELARALGVSVKASTLGPGISGEIRPADDGGFVIRINRHDPPKRQRFTVAHELAHFLLHSDEIGNGIEDDVLYRSSLSDRREQQANRLAADILMPGDLVAEAREAAEEKGVGDVVLYLADLFAVSEAAMRIKIGQ
ncbi:ImmA/IrrE family metallo-endopeptidase [Sphingomonas ginsenosidivorax]|uniref:ImmA/IrrE family metallo-endopeptidase n=1 Tax=Sphingomonas ginsenosidivorax TaxID=862135 RepID=A0A5C6UBJ0_9SPHN|nr:ImmA/IrrE family metallo-endopeptidase [Sphingomonas ginsenosidivorax]TXC69601.1 ImmA/IrrE family metallo-endopeptidase [Sphingomonas ginsenosidivorax]